jgi:hypothetical protein
MNDNYLRRIRQTYDVQVRVPRPLVPRLGKQHLLKCTKTRDILEARRRRHAIVAKFHQLIDAARQLQVSHEGGIVGELLDEAALMRRQINAGQLKREKVVGVTDYDPETGKLLEVPGAWKLMLERPERLPLSALSDAQSLADVHDTHLELPEAKSDAGLRKVPWHPLARPLVQRLVETSTDGYLVAGQRPAGYDGKRGDLFVKRFSYFKQRRH